MTYAAGPELDLVLITLPKPQQLVAGDLAYAYLKPDDAERFASQIISAVYDARQWEEKQRVDRIAQIRQQICDLNNELLRLDSADAEEKEETPAAAPSPWLVDPVVYPQPPLGPPLWQLPDTVFDPLYNPAVGAVVFSSEPGTFMGFDIMVDPSLPDDCVYIRGTGLLYNVKTGLCSSYRRNNDHEQDGA